MGNLTNALIVVMCINVALFLGQISMDNINSSQTHSLYACKGSLLEEFDNNKCAGNYSLANETKITDNLPSVPQSLPATIGQFFVDVFTAVSNFITETLGLKYVIAIFSAPYHIMSAFLPQEFAFAIGALWYVVTGFLVVAWLKGGEA